MRRLAGWLLVALSMTVATAHAAEPAKDAAVTASSDKKPAEDTERLPAKTKRTEPGLENERRIAEESAKNEVDRRGRLRRERVRETGDRALPERGGRF